MAERLALYGGAPTITQPLPHYRWPRITESVRAAVALQLETDISLMDRSGVFRSFEETFRKFHGRDFALLCNSGTSALHAMYVGAGLEPHDEVIVPVYTFHATVTPLLHVGATPVFCDCGSDGNMDPVKAEALIGPRTKAIVVTHLFGLPCDMDAFTALSQRYNLLLFEDCSHAHGARYRDAPVGSFGDGAAWSFQGQKIISGGEGGMLLTDDHEMYIRAQLLGHYNKRCRQEIPPTHPFYELATTGFGLKHRAHPLAVAIAREQFGHLEEFRAGKSRFADRFAQALRPFEFITLSQYGRAHTSPTWYLLAATFDEVAAGASRELFVNALHAEGLAEIEAYTYLQPLHELPLFQRVPPIGPIRWPTSKRPGGLFDCARSFCQSLVKIPAWSFADEEPIVGQYIQGLTKVCAAIEKGLLRDRVQGSSAQ